MHGRVAPALVVEAAGCVKVCKELAVLAGAEEAQVGNLKVAPEVAEVPGVAGGGA